MVIEVRNLITKTYNITFDTDEKYQIVIDNNVVEYGSNKSFLVELNEAYQKTDDFKVLVNDVEINCTNEYYEINNITENKVITICGIEKKSVQISFINSVGLELDYETLTIFYNEDFIIYYSLSTGYEFQDFKIFINDVQNTSFVNETILLENITQNTKIEFRGVEKKSYIISMQIVKKFYLITIFTQLVI